MANRTTAALRGAQAPSSRASIRDLEAGRTPAYQVPIWRDAGLNYNYPGFGMDPELALLTGGPGGGGGAGSGSGGGSGGGDNPRLGGSNLAQIIAGDGGNQDGWNLAAPAATRLVAGPPGAGVGGGTAAQGGGDFQREMSRRDAELQSRVGSQVAGFLASLIGNAIAPGIGGLLLGTLARTAVGAATSPGSPDPKGDGAGQPSGIAGPPATDVTGPGPGTGTAAGPGSSGGAGSGAGTGTGGDASGGGTGSTGGAAGGTAGGGTGSAGGAGGGTGTGSGSGAAGGSGTGAGGGTGTGGGTGGGTGTAAGTGTGTGTGVGTSPTGNATTDDEEGTGTGQRGAPAETFDVPAVELDAIGQPISPSFTPPTVPEPQVIEVTPTRISFNPTTLATMTSVRAPAAPPATVAEPAPAKDFGATPADSFQNEAPGAESGVGDSKDSTTGDVSPDNPADSGMGGKGDMGGDDGSGDGSAGGVSGEAPGAADGVGDSKGGGEDGTGDSSGGSAGDAGGDSSSGTGGDAGPGSAGSDGNSGPGGEGGGFRIGGVIPGNSNGLFEPVEITAHEGEFVLRPEAVQAIGLPFLEALNQLGGRAGPATLAVADGSAPPRQAFRDGGEVTASQGGPVVPQDLLRFLAPPATLARPYRAGWPENAPPAAPPAPLPLPPPATLAAPPAFQGDEEDVSWQDGEAGEYWEQEHAQAEAALRDRPYGDVATAPDPFAPDAEADLPGGAVTPQGAEQRLATMPPELQQVALATLGADPMVASAMLHILGPAFSPLIRKAMPARQPGAALGGGGGGLAGVVPMGAPGGAAAGGWR